MRTTFLQSFNSRTLLTLTLVLVSIATMSDVYANSNISILNGQGDNCVVCHTRNLSSAADGKPGLKALCLTKFPGGQGKFTNVFDAEVCIPPFAIENLTDTPPTINSVATEWTTGVGKELIIPLYVNDAQGDDFDIIPVDATIKTKTPPVLSTEPNISAPYSTDSGLTARDFKWKPDTAAEYIVKFTAKETATKKLLSSKPLSVKIHVLPAFTDNAPFSHLIVSNAKWTKDTMNVYGKIVFDKNTTAEQKAALSTTIRITDAITGNPLVDVNADQTIALDPDNGNWSVVSLSYKPLNKTFPCNVSVEFEGQKVIHAIAGAPKDCVK